MSTSYLPAEIRYSGASYRRCGRSGLRLPPVSLGLRHDEVVSVITGASRVSQLEQTLDVANAAPLSGDQLAAIDGVLG